MKQSLENNFGNDDQYKDLFAKQIYLYVLNQVKKEQTWSKDTEHNIAYDITMEAITRLLEKEKNGAIINSKYSYLIQIVKNELIQKRFIFHKVVRRYSTDKVRINANSSGERTVPELDENQLLYASSNQQDTYTIHAGTSGIFMLGSLNIEEQQVANLMNEGYSGKEIATKIGKSESTVSRLTNSIRFKLDKTDL